MRIYAFGVARNARKSSIGIDFGDVQMEKVTCNCCIYGRNIGGNDWGCLSEKRRADHKKLVNNPIKEPFDCEYGELYKRPLRGEL